MNWFLISLIGPILYATNNHIDKYLISKYFNQSTAIGSLIIFSSIFSIVALPIILFIQPNILSIPITQALILIAMGICVIIAILLYFYAIETDEVTFVMPFYQTIPIFGFILAYFILGETLTSLQIYASLIIVCGASILSFDLQKEKITFKSKVVIFMLSASLLYAISDVLFKFVAIQHNFWNSLFWILVGKVIIGVFFITCIKSYRQQFIKTLKSSGSKIILLNSSNEALTIIADGATAYATLLAPIALVLSVNSAQPLFVFILGVLLSIFFPHISNESLSKKVLTQKIAGIVIIIVGSYLINI